MTFKIEEGRDANGSTKLFILVTGGMFKHSPGFLSWDGSLIRFDTKADATLFCLMANAGFISFPFCNPTKSKPKQTNDN